jgi:hypothetical protein
MDCNPSDESDNKELDPLESTESFIQSGLSCQGSQPRYYDSAPFKTQLFAVMEDVSPATCYNSWDSETVPMDKVETLLKVIARLHSCYWEAPLLQESWLYSPYPKIEL